MRRGGAGLFAAMLALGGCKGTNPKPPDRETPGTPAARNKDGTPPWLNAVGGPHAVPKANSWTDPKDPSFNPSAEVQGVLGGRVVDPFGRGAGNVYIRLDLADPTPAERQKGGAPVGIMTDAQGYFQAKGLKAKRSYNLTAEAKIDGKPHAAVMQAPTPNPTLTLHLRDDLAAPGESPSTPAGTLPPPVDVTPSAGTVSTPPPAPRPASDGAWSPSGTPATRPVPHSLGTPAVPTPTLPPPADIAPRATTKPENIADGPRDPWKPPATSIPGLAPIPKLPPPMNVAPPPDPKRSAAPRPGANFALRDSQGRPWEFATSVNNLVLLDFMTTTCVPCKKALPVLTGLQERYGASGLDVVGVVCDPVGVGQRVALADKYYRAQNLNYLMYTEDAAEQGSLFRKYADANTGYPFVVLLDAGGNVLWKGHPGDRGPLEAAIRQHTRAARE